MLLFVLVAPWNARAADEKERIQIIEWGTIGEVKPFITRQLTVEEYQKRNILRLQYQVQCRCSCGYCCCRLCPVEVLHEERYAVHTRRTFLYGPPVECWIEGEATPEAPKKEDEKIRLGKPLPYFAARNSLDSDVLRLQRTVRDPDEKADPADTSADAARKTKLDDRKYAWGRNQVWRPTDGKKLILVWNVHNDVNLASVRGSITFHAKPEAKIEVLLLGHPNSSVECENLNIITGGNVLKLRVEKDGEKAETYPQSAELRDLSRVVFIASAEVARNGEPLVWATWSNPDGGKDLSVSAPFEQIKEHFKLDREFRAIRTYERDKP